MNRPILQIDFSRPAPVSVAPVVPVRKDRGYQHMGGGDYIDRRTGHHYQNVRINGRYTWRKLSALTHPAALKEIRKKRSDLELSKLGLALNPYLKTHSKTVDDLAKYYLDKNCPRKNRSALRQGQELIDEKKRVAMLRTWPGLRKPYTDFKLEHCGQYHAWRVAKIADAKLQRAGGDPSKITDNRTGDRQVDKELVTLSNIFRCAMRHTGQTGVETNPIALDRGQFRDAEKVVHCREHQPANGDELHAIARTLLQSWRSAPLGWQALFEAMIGPRSHEILRLRMDAQNKDQPGFIKWNEKKDGGTLFLFHSESSKGTYGHIRIHAALTQCLKAHAAWHAEYWPKSPWYFPSPEDPSKPIGRSSLTHALRRVTAELKLPHRTSHGLRSYSVNVLRSDRRADGTHRYTDAEIALRHGQKSNGKLISNVYGIIKEEDESLSYMPSPGKRAAWEPDVPTLQQAEWSELLQAAQKRHGNQKGSQSA